MSDRKCANVGISADHSAALSHAAYCRWEQARHHDVSTRTTTGESWCRRGRNVALVGEFGRYWAPERWGGS